MEFLITDKTPGLQGPGGGQAPRFAVPRRHLCPGGHRPEAQGLCRALRPDGKLDLSLDQAGYRRVAPLALRIVQDLQRSGGRLDLDDDSPPEAIRQAFGTSKGLQTSPGHPLQNPTHPVFQARHRALG